MQLDHEEVQWLVNQLERAAKSVELLEDKLVQEGHNLEPNLVIMAVQLAAARLKYKMGHKSVLLHDERTWSSTNLTVDRFLNKGKE